MFLLTIHLVNHLGRLLFFGWGGKVTFQGQCSTCRLGICMNIFKFRIHSFLISSPSIGVCYADVVAEAWHVCFAAGIQERDDGNGYDMS